MAERYDEYGNPVPRKGNGMAKLHHDNVEVVIDCVGMPPFPWVWSVKVDGIIFEFGAEKSEDDCKLKAAKSCERWRLSSD